MTKRTKYIIEVAGHHAGTHIVEVVNDESTIRPPLRYVTSTQFGCSKNYQVGSDYEAVCRLLTEHASPLVNYLKIDDVIRIPGYEYPLQIGELNDLDLSAVLYPAWHDDKGDWHSITVGFRLHTTLSTDFERVN